MSASLLIHLCTIFFFLPEFRLELASSLGCASTWYVDGCGFDPLVRQHSFMEIGHENLYSHFPPTADSSRAVVSNVRKDVH